MFYLSYLSIVFVGVTLGIFGGGGSILIIPILHYLLGIDIFTSIIYSYFIVGLSSLIGVIYKSYHGEISFKKGLVFALPSIIFLLYSRFSLLPAIPANINFGLIEISKQTLILVLLSLIMFITSISLFFKKQESPKAENTIKRSQKWSILISSSFVGIISGLSGAGGGFLITPALFKFFNLKLNQAIATSLFVIVINSLIGFLIGYREPSILDWSLLLTLCLLSIIGVFLGLLINQFINTKNLKIYLAAFIMAIAFFILINEFSF